MIDASDGDFFRDNPKLARVEWFSDEQVDGPAIVPIADTTSTLGALRLIGCLSGTATVEAYGNHGSCRMETFSRARTMREREQGR